MSFDWREGGKMKALFLAVLVLGSVVVFSLGVMVGTQLKLLNGNGRQASTTPAATTADSRQVVPLQPKGSQMKGEGMSFYDTLPEATRPQTTTLPKASQPAPPVNPVVTQPAEPAEATDVVAQITAARPAPPAVKAPAPAPPPVEPAKPPAPAKAAEEKAKPVEQAKEVPAPAPARKFSVQVLKTSSRAKAESAEEEMGALGYPAVIISTRRGEFAVRVSQTTVEADARKALAAVVKKSRFKDAWLVKE